MNSTRVGNAFERQIFVLLETEIGAGRFWATPDNCRLFHKKAYYSRDRESHITFDIAIEIYLPGADTYSMVVLVECKNYTHAVRVDDAEEFFQKIQQVAAANAKGIIASTAAFQSGTQSFARSKGIALLRYFDRKQFKWELYRSQSAAYGSYESMSRIEVAEALSRDDFQSDVHDLFMQSPVRQTSSLWNLIADLAVATPLGSSEIRQLTASYDTPVSQVHFVSKPTLEELGRKTLQSVDYTQGEVPLEAICAVERTRSGLDVRLGEAPDESAKNGSILGRMVFDPPTIVIYKQPMQNRGRVRFTLAHELAHYLLDHGKYMAREFCESDDFGDVRARSVLPVDIARMEFQANYLAGCLLMPNNRFAADFQFILARLGLSDKGFGMLYVDSQPCNINSFFAVTNHLRAIYGVSRQAIRLRLAGLGFLRDDRPEKIVTTVRSVMQTYFATADRRE